MPRKPAPTTLLDLSRVDWSGIGDLVCQALAASLKNRDQLVREYPEAEGFEPIAAAAITQLVTDRLKQEAQRQAAERG